MILNALALSFLAVAAVLELWALCINWRPPQSIGPNTPGAIAVSPDAKRHHRAQTLAILGVLAATLGSAVSMWAPGFMD
ncbi:hypothetical protein BJY20_002600 [Janibacter cremeus]|uniref:Uncharacterized protein n=1 Tax=Janibacter cremeus TaxID=1285192 RepID=A0A852VTE5_9MICO|nr:hypothetical protein [Janibacter cremeus]